ncbi:MAG: 50S ribosomal protein L4 [Candidatus Pacebacteria bacterium]|nr:50S ribosomal protein L4 [Candidatus Paceibacterota bacterium]
MEATVYNQKGKETGKVKLPEAVFGVHWNSDLVHQVTTSMKTNARKPVAHTKTRGEVRGGGKKPWRQKGTGRARHGSTRSPIWVGGGVAHGPRNDQNFDRKINRSMKAKALYTILSRKLKDKEIIFLDTMNLEGGKTKDAKEIVMNLGKIAGFEKLSTKRKNAAYITLGHKDVAIERGFSNFGNVTVDELRNMNPMDLMQNAYLIITEPEKSFEFLSSKIPAKTK